MLELFLLINKFSSTPILHSSFHSQPSKQKRKFSSFFKSLVIELDKELYGPDNHLVEVRVVLEPGRDKLPGNTERNIIVLVESYSLSASDGLCHSLPDSGIGCLPHRRQMAFR